MEMTWICFINIAAWKIYTTKYIFMKQCSRDKAAQTLIDSVTTETGFSSALE